MTRGPRRAMMWTTWTCALALASLGSAPAVRADDYTSASAEALTAAAVAAVEAEEAGTLLALLQEMQRREMFFFEDDDALCDRDAPKVGILATNILDWGKARQAYFTSNRMQRLEEQSCVCPQKARSFADFSRQLLGVAPEEIGEDEVDVLRAFVEENKDEVRTAYYAFYDANCRSNP